MTATRLLAVLGLCAAVANGAFAQPAADANVPKHACAKPGDVPGHFASDSQRKAWQKDNVVYTDCLKKFITEQKALVDPHFKAYNAAVDEYNGAVKAFNEQIEKARDPNK